MEQPMPSTAYSVVLLLPTADIDDKTLKQMIGVAGIKARYNSGPIPKSLAKTFAPSGGMIFPISMQDTIFDPLDECDYSDFDISKYWSRRDKKEIEQHGASNHLIAACYASKSELENLDRQLNLSGVYVWHWHQWVLISRLDQMRWAY